MKKLKICVLSNAKRITWSYDVLYPLYKFHHVLNRDGYNIEIIYDHSLILSRQWDIIILCSRYFDHIDRNIDVIEYISTIKSHCSKVIWFDTVDPSGSDTFHVIEHVDMFLKKQVLKDKSIYLNNDHDKSVRVWLDENPEQLKYSEYQPCKEKDIQKIRVGWNIGYCNYQYISKYLNCFRNYIFIPPKIFPVEGERSIDLTFRGELNYKNAEISVQRNKVISELKKIKGTYPQSNIMIGEIFPYGTYLKELSKSKLSISPFGWGEICYRDFESLLAGSLLLKPNMNHIDTFPNIYAEENYIPLKWDLSDLNDKFSDCLNNYDQYKSIGKKAQYEYVNYLNNPSVFCNHFKNIIHSL